MADNKLGAFRKWASDKFATSVTDTAKRNLNAMLDAVEDFEDRGGLNQYLGELPASAAQLLYGAHDGKPLRQYYANLESPYGSDLATVKKNYRRLMRKYHPDRHSGDPEREKLATELSQELTRAYDTVCEHIRRRSR
jgi:DnaJ-domain-containing protein 1